MRIKRTLTHLGLVWWLLAATTAPLLAQTYTDAQIVEITDRAIELSWQSKTDEAYALLAPVNTATFNSDAYPPHIQHYPNLGFAIYSIAQSDWPDTIRYASSVTSALDIQGYRDHPTRLRAFLHYGRALFEMDRDREAATVFSSLLAEPNLDTHLPDVHYQALFWASRAALSLDTKDAVSIYSAFLDVAENRPVAPLSHSAVTQVKYAYLKEMGDRDLMTLPEQIAFAEKMMEVVNTEASMSEYARLFYDAYLGDLLGKAGDQKAALKKLRRFHDYLTAKETFVFDYNTNAYRMARFVYSVEGAQAAYDFVFEVVKNIENEDTSPIDLAIFHRDLGTVATHLDNPELSQHHLRTAYVYARKLRRVNDSLVLRIAARIDTDDPNFSDFELAYEFGQDTGTDIILTPDGERAFALVYEGNYLAALDHLDKAETLKSRDPAMYYLNRAAVEAVINRVDDATNSLKQARRALRTTLGSAVDSASPVPDLIEIYNLVYISNSNIAKAKGPINRLRARFDSLDPQQQQFFLALEANYLELSGQYYSRDRALEHWVALSEANPITNIYGSMSHLIADGMLHTALDIETSAAAFARHEAYLQTKPDMGLMLDLATMLQGSHTIAFGNSGEGLARLGRLQQAVSVQLPKGHPSVSMVRYQLAEAYLSARRGADALRWYGLTLEALYENPYAQNDIIAFMISRQASALWELGRGNEATIMAKSAFDKIRNDDKAFSGTVANVIELYVTLLAFENGNYKEAADILRTFIDDPKFFKKLPTNNQYYLMKRWAAFVAEFGTTEETLAAFTVAQDMLETSVTGERRFEQANILFEKAKARYWSLENATDKQATLAAAFDEIKRANELFFEWREAISAANGAQANQISGQFGTGVVAFNAAISWDYAQTLAD